MQEAIMPERRKFRSAAVQELYDETIGDDPAAQEEFEEELVNIEAAQLIHDMRTKAGLSQRELARKVGTSASAINRLESADYQGHTLAMVRRIAGAVNRRVELRAVPIKNKAHGSGGYSQRNATIGSTRAARRPGR
jgi:ribosome-binding protein aMBF1 (putative translation factor)